MPRRAVCLLAATLALWAPWPTSGQASRPAGGDGFTVAVLRRDGILLPFASYRRGRWSSQWPVRDATDVPLTLRDVPHGWWHRERPVTEWSALLASGVVQPITVQAPVSVAIHCSRRIGLRTTFRPPLPPPPPSYQPFPKDGLASSVEGAIERIELVPPGAPEAAAALRLVTDGVNDAEDARVGAWRPRWRHPQDQAARRKTSLTLELLARTPGLEPATRVYYFEGVKRYPGFTQDADPWSPGRTESCDYLTFAGGWLFQDAREAFDEGQIGAELSNCNREGLTYVLPLGAVRADGRLFWIVQTSAWDLETYDVVEIKARSVRPVLSFLGGSCRQ